MARRKLKVGLEVWHVFADPEYGVELNKYVLRTIRSTKWAGKTAYFIIKNSATWVKKSRKHGDYGWDDNIDSCFRRDVTLEKYESDGLPSGLSFTKSGAYKLELASTRGYLKRCESNSGYDQSELGEIKKLIKTLERMYKQYKNKRQ